MPAGQTYDKYLNTVKNNKQTPFVYDPNLDEWIAYVKPAERLTAITHSVLTVTTASQTALAANANRKYASFQNDSDTAIYLKIGAAAVANEGIRINPNGGSYEMSAAIGNLATGTVYAIHGGTGTKNLLIAEGV